MKSNAPPNDDDAGPWASEWALEESLRRLPTPGTPPGLGARLIGAIPRHEVVRKVSPSPLARRRWFAWASLAAAILVLATIVAQRGDRDVAVGPPSGVAVGPPSGSGDDRQGTQRTVFVVTKETDPCNILPPLRDSL